MSQPTDDLDTTLAVVVVQGETSAAGFMRNGRPRVSRTVMIRPLTSTAIYDALAALYNDAQVGALLVVNLPNRPTSGNLHKVLCGRGLDNRTDYTIFRAKADVNGTVFPPSQRPMVLERLSPKPMHLNSVRAAQARIIADEATLRGAMDMRLLYAPALGEAGAVEVPVDLPIVKPLPIREEDLPQNRQPNPLDTEADRELRMVRLPDLDFGE